MEMKIYTKMKSHYIHTRIAKIKRLTIISSVEEDAEQMEFSKTGSGNVNDNTTQQNILAVFLKS